MRLAGPAERKVHAVGHDSLRHFKHPWTAAEDALLRDAYMRIAATQPEPIPWSRIAELVPDRTGKQCRERWVHHLRPMVDKSAWTEEEDGIIFDQLALVGRRWASIAALLSGRTAQQIKNRYYSCMRRLARRSLSQDGSGAGAAEPSSRLAAAAAAAASSAAAAGGALAALKGSSASSAGGGGAAAGDADDDEDLAEDDGAADLDGADDDGADGIGGEHDDDGADDDDEHASDVE